MPRVRLVTIVEEMTTPTSGRYPKRPSGIDPLCARHEPQNTDAVGSQVGTTEAHAMNGRAVPRRRQYTITVAPVEHGERYGVRITVTDSAGTVIHRVAVTDVLFTAAADAETTGWRLADEWTARLSDPSAESKPLGSDERALLVGCDHTVAVCDVCRLHHGLFELYANCVCARCHADLTASMRRHLAECPQIVIRRAEALREVTALTRKEDRRLREAAEVKGGESEAGRPPRRAGAQRPRPTSGSCPGCDRVIEPGEPVSFRHGVIVHLRCYLDGQQP